MPDFIPGNTPDAISERTSCLADIHPPAYPDVPYCDNMQYFYNHPVISELAQQTAWTVSGRTSGKEKVPLDAVEYDLMYGKIQGAKTHDSSCLMTLPNVWRTFQPEIQGREHVPYAFYLDCMRDGYVCLDAEPDCDPELRKKFLKLPFLYGEFSMSGKGLHLIFKLPTEIMEKYPIAKKKIKMQHSTGTYEILMCHYMTFTGNMLYAAQDQLDISEFYDIFEDLCKAQTNQEKTHDFAMEELLDKDEIPGFVSVMWMLRFTKLRKSQAEYASPSHYEYGVTSKIMYDLFDILHRNPIELNNHKYTQQEMTMLLYYKLKEMIPHREKHDGIRDGMPYLVYMCQSIISKNPTPYDDDYITKEKYKEMQREKKGSNKDDKSDPDENNES